MSLQPQISILPPPGPSVLALAPSHQSPTSSPPVLFRLALAVRIAVFVDEQKCLVANEIDADDPRSWHWIAFAPPPPGPVPSALDPSHLGLVCGGEIAAATIRLVPVSVTPQKGQEMEFPIPQGPSQGPTRMWDGAEPYIKLGRLATVPPRRGLGLARALVETVLAWATENASVLRSASGAELLGGGGGGGEDAEMGDGRGNGWSGLVLTHAQVSAEKFWARMGFVTDPGMGTWGEDGIRHVAMWRRVAVS